MTLLETIYLITHNPLWSHKRPYTTFSTLLSKIGEVTLLALFCEARCTSSLKDQRGQDKQHKEHIQPYWSCVCIMNTFTFNLLYFNAFHFSTLFFVLFYIVTLLFLHLYLRQSVMLFISLADTCCDQSITLQTHEGATASFDCPYAPADQNNLKYVCRGNLSSTCLQQALINSTSQQSGRFRLQDDTRVKTFKVTIISLIQADSGRYLCGVHRDTGLDVFTAVDLQVKGEWKWFFLILQE